MIYFQCSFHTTLKILVKTKNYTLFFSLIQFLPSIHSHMVLKGFETSEGFPILFTFRTFSTVRFLSVCFCVWLPKEMRQLKAFHIGYFSSVHSYMSTKGSHTFLIFIHFFLVMSSFMTS